MMLVSGGGGGSTAPVTTPETIDRMGDVEYGGNLRGLRKQQPTVVAPEAEQL